MRTKPAGNETQEQMMRGNFGSRDHGQKVKGAVRMKNWRAVKGVVSQVNVD